MTAPRQDGAETTRLRKIYDMAADAVASQWKRASRLRRFQHARLATPMTSEAFKRHFEKASADYRRRLPAKLAELDRLWNELTNGSGRPAAIVDLQRELHTLAGTAQTMGAPAVTETARAAEVFLEPYAAGLALPEPAAQREFALLLDAIRRAAQSPEDA